MGATRFPHGIFASPNIGGGRLSDIFASENIFFVDGINGSAGNEGQSPDNSVALPSTAVGFASAYGTVYVKPMQYHTYATQTNRYYTDNVTVPVTKPGISIIGAGNQITHYMMVEMKASTVTSPVITVNAPGTHIEGMRLTGTGQTAGYSIIHADSDGSATNGGGGLSILNCTFSNGKGLGAASAAIDIDNPWNSAVYNCIFHNCQTGIRTTSSISSTNGMWIRDCIFEGLAANRDVDIYASGGSSNCYGYLIDNCRFNGGLPAHASGTIKRFIDIVDSWGTTGGMISNCNFSVDADAATGLAGASGTKIVFPASTWWIVNCFGEAQTDADGGWLSRC